VRDSTVYHTDAFGPFVSLWTLINDSRLNPLSLPASSTLHASTMCRYYEGRWFDERHEGIAVSVSRFGNLSVAIAPDLRNG
jgi:hypothetical protein